MWIYELAQLTSIININMYMYGSVQSFFVLLQSSDLLSSNLLLGQSTIFQETLIRVLKDCRKDRGKKKKKKKEVTKATCSYLPIYCHVSSHLFLICSYTYVYAYTDVCSFYEITVANTVGVQK